MKKGFSLLFLGLLISLTFLNSCTKETLPSLNCKIDGTLWSSLVRVTTMGATDVGDGILIVATDGLSTTEGKYLSMLIRGNTVKDYDLAITLVGGQLECTALWAPSGLASTEGKKYYGKSGKISITKIDTENKLITGTYSFVLSTTGGELVTITDGKFANLKYINAAISVTDFIP